MSSPVGRHPVLVLAILVGLAVLPVIMPASRIVDGMRSASPASDFALLELSTGEALRATQLLGPYSRFGWRHPGPAYFYLLAPLYGVSGASSASLPVAVLIFNWAALLQAGGPSGAPPAIVCARNGASDLCVWLIPGPPSPSAR
jgi:hypothetical protein